MKVSERNGYTVVICVAPRTIRREFNDELTINQRSEVKWKMRTAAPPRGIKQLRRTAGHDVSLDYRKRLVCQLLCQFFHLHASIFVRYCTLYTDNLLHVLNVKVNDALYTCICSYYFTFYKYFYHKSLVNNTKYFKHKEYEICLYYFNIVRRLNCNSYIDKI